ncbi:hypothetical protein L6R29_09310 [Myxococcota bacterium]|nr:hypothetical protein [Myxococcota bacterium]
MLKVSALQNKIAAQTAPANPPTADAFKEKIQQAANNKTESKKLYACTAGPILRAAVNKHKAENKSNNTAPQKPNTSEKTEEKNSSLSDELDRYITEALGPQATASSASKKQESSAQHNTSANNATTNNACSGTTKQTTNSASSASKEPPPTLDDIFRCMDALGIDPSNQKTNPLDPKRLQSILGNPKATPDQKKAARYLLKHQAFLNKPAVNEKVRTAHGCHTIRQNLVKMMIQMLLAIPPLS